MGIRVPSSQVQQCRAAGTDRNRVFLRIRVLDGREKRDKGGRFLRKVSAEAGHGGGEPCPGPLRTTYYLTSLSIACPPSLHSVRTAHVHRYVGYLQARRSAPIGRCLRRARNCYGSLAQRSVGGVWQVGLINGLDRRRRRLRTLDADLHIALRQPGKLPRRARELGIAGFRGK